MSKPFDRRHRWGAPIESGARITRVCSVCGRSESYDRIVPDAVVHEFLRWVGRPNPYRALIKP